jgi:hypothetical protein
LEQRSTAFLPWLNIATMLILLIMIIRHSERYGKGRGPMSPRTRNLLMWFAAIVIVFSTAWEMHAGKMMFFTP